ncbi:hypothetical protein [Sphingomicrobium nitratireducens]|uniref:hypothetical protein n=1 Tax=Sphingomicrobium nitratireducens TaxID=2964666 RepID=UPI00224088DE|nr:hypothetical protein [Sphingomicrobium nitratireducens]
MRVLSSLLAAGLVLAAPSQAAEPDGVGTEQMVFAHQGNEQAGGHFLRGLALLHNFEYERAAEEFVAAQEADPDWVMPYWGEAMTHNHSIWWQQDREAALAAMAKLGKTPQARAAKARDDKERAWLGAVETLYGEGEKRKRDFAYRGKMKALFEADPDDVDARAFYALSILGTTHDGRDVPTYMQSAAILEDGFMAHEMHPGLLHYLIHSYDDPVHAPLGLRAAQRYSVVAPDAGHAQHMVSHIFNALGMWEASEKANVNADAVVDRQRERDGHCGHYNEWLAYALLQQGKDASALIDGCRDEVVAAMEEGANPRSYSWARMALWKGVETGDYATPLAWGEGKDAAARMMVAYGLALAARDDAAAAAAQVAELKALHAALIEDGYDGSEDTAWGERMVAQAEAVALLAAGREAEGLAALGKAGEAEAALPAFYGPPLIGKPSYELLGDELLALGLRQEAADAYDKALAFAPGRRQSVAGLAAARQ